MAPIFDYVTFDLASQKLPDENISFSELTNAAYATCLDHGYVLNLASNSCVKRKPNEVMSCANAEKSFKLQFPYVTIRYEPLGSDFTNWDDADHMYDTDCREIGLPYGTPCEGTTDTEGNSFCTEVPDARKCDFYATEPDEQIVFTGGHRCKWMDGCKEDSVVAEKDGKFRVLCKDGAFSNIAVSVFGLLSEAVFLKKKKTFTPGRTQFKISFIHQRILNKD